MHITEIHVKLSEAAVANIHQGHNPIQPPTPNGDHGIRGVIAYCSIVLDGAFVIDEAKLIRGLKGLHVSMPSRKVTFRNRCGHNNPFDNRYCGTCGTKLPIEPPPDTPVSRHIDICHPIAPWFRRALQEAMEAAAQAEIQREMSNPPPARTDIAHPPQEQ